MGFLPALGDVKHHSMAASQPLFILAEGQKKQNGVKDLSWG